MVKMVNSQAAKLAEARNTIEELKKENAALRLENKLLRASRSASAPITPKRWPTISPNVCKPVCSEKTYDRPTRASTIRAAEARRETRPAEKVKRAEAHFGDETYVYVDGHPIRSTGLQIPRFMFGTQSSNAKREWCCVRARFLVHPTTHINDDSDSQEGCDTTPLDDTTLSGGTTASEDNVIIPQVPVLRTSQELHSVLEDSISVDRLFPGRIVRIRGDTGFKILQTAHRIAQEALYDAARKFVCIKSPLPYLSKFQTLCFSSKELITDLNIVATHVGASQRGTARGQARTTRTRAVRGRARNARGSVFMRVHDSRSS